MDSLPARARRPCGDPRRHLQHTPSRYVGRPERLLVLSPRVRPAVDAAGGRRPRLRRRALPPVRQRDARRARSCPLRPRLPGLRHARSGAPPSRWSQRGRRPCPLLRPRHVVVPVAAGASPGGLRLRRRSSSSATSTWRTAPSSRSTPTPPGAVARRTRGSKTPCSARSASWRSSTPERRPPAGRCASSTTATGTRPARRRCRRSTWPVRRGRSRTWSPRSIPFLSEAERLPAAVLSTGEIEPAVDAADPFEQAERETFAAAAPGRIQGADGIAKGEPATIAPNASPRRRHRRRFRRDGDRLSPA